MAHTESTSSPRNHAADENPELARKKQKISCNEGDVGASPDDPLLIEDVTDPEDLGASMANAIEIEEEATEPYINAFHPSPIPRLRDLQTRIDHNQYIDFAEFNWLSKALSNHLNATANEPHAWRRHYVEEEAELFVMLASVSHRLVITENLFEKKFDISKDKPQASFEEFICSILTLARRILPFLPDAVKTILSRRDSAQGSMRPQSLGSLYYITLAATLVSPGEPSAVTQFSGRAGTMEAVIADAPNFFLHDDVVRALAAVIRLISGAMRELMDSWLTLQNALAIFRSVIARRHNADEFPKLEAEEIMDVLCGTIRPAIAAKHPRALPDGFHESVIAFGEEMLSAHTRIHGLSSASDLYERYVKHTDDAMIPQAADNSSISTSLWRICGQNYKVLAQLLSDSWAFQTAKAFIRSDIMDVRSVGMLALKSRLVRVHNNGQKSPEGFESPVVQYAVRYMRENEITAYIFGPESHAGLITQSYDVVAFLAATLSLTDVEIDIIWRACCTSVEADFVKAAFGCLSYLAKFMDLRGLLHVADKYTSTPVSRLNGHAADMLSWWLMDLERKTSDPNRRFERQQLTLTSVRILRHIDTCQASALTNSLRHSALTQISQLAERNYPLEERAEVYKHCLPEICGFTQHATSSMDILSMYVRHDISSEEAAFIVSILPIAAAVDELCEYVGRPPRPGDLRVDAVAVRLECIIRLIALTDKEDDPSMDPRLFTQVFGASSADSHVRNAAWEKLHSMATTGNAKISGTATRMWKGFMQNFVPSLSADLASPTLVQFVALSLRQECQSEDMPPEFVNILDLPLWDAIVRFATCSPTAGVIESATGAILDLLFIFPINSRFSPASISQCHIKFVESHIERLRIVFANIDQAADSPGRREFWHGMDLLHWLLRRSRETLSPLKLTEESGALCVGDPSDHSDRITFEVQIHGPDVQPRNMPVAASAFSKVPELLAALSATLGASHIKIIAGGVDITTAGEQTLAEAGVRQSGVILVCPRFKPSDDIDKALVRAGPVEQAILAQYSSVEAFLDGPDAAAGKAFALLCVVRLSSEARNRVTSADSSATDLFPPSKSFRTRFSLHVLQKHTFDLTRVAVVDQAFAQRGVRLLVAVIMDDTRSADPYLMVEVLKVLLLFLRGNSDRMDSEIWSNANMAAERPTEGHLTPYFDNPNAFVERLSDLLLEARGMAADLLLAPDDNTPLRSELAGLIYQALLEACQADGALWDAITDHEDSMVDIHSKLLLDDDYILSERIARHIKLVCQEAGTARAVPNFYWRILWPALGYALEHRENSRPYFTLLVEVLNSDQITQSDQSGVQSLIETLLASLDAYEHHEASSLLIRDEGTAGLLQLLLASVKLLKKFTMQLGLDDLPCRLLRTLLFPRIDIPRARPLVDESSRTLVYDLIRSTFTSGTDYLDLLCITYDAMQTLPHDPTSRYPGAQDWLRFGSNSTGLTNLGMTCYMNSLLQQLFANLQFRKFILDEPVVDCQKQAVLAGLQSLFARMQSAIEPCANTTALAYALNVQIGVQEDVHTFYTTLLSQLEDNMPNQAQKTALTHFFTGKFVTQIKGECGHVSSRVEPFTELSITVKNKANLHDSLDEFVQGEPLEGANKYMCMTCTPGDRGRLVNAMKRTCLDEVPDSLTFCLKRFAFDNMQDGENKVNDRFDFPPEIDISMYKRDYLESPAETQDPDVFELVGVIVHQGSLGYGHYWSYVRVAGQPYDAPGAWLYVEDGITKQCTGGVKAIQQECSGGLAWDDGSERLDSGYVLFYQRRSYIAEANDVNKISKSLRASHGILPRVELPASLAAETEKENLWRTRIASLFEPQFNSFVLWLIGQFPSAIKARNLSAEAMETSEDEEESSPQPDIDNLNARMGDLVAHYALRVVLVDPFGETRLTGLVSGLTTILDAQPATALHVLKPFYMNDLAFNAIARNRNASVRATLLDFIHTCLNCLEAHHPRDYHNILDPIIRMHWSILVSVVEPMPSRWEEYLAFASRLAVQGPKETRMVLDMGYWNWTLGILYIHYDPGLRKLHSKLSTYLKNNGGADHSPLFGFLSDLLSDWVDLSVVYDDIIAAGGDRIRTHIGWSLTSAEIGSLFFLQEKNSSNLWILFLTMCTQCPTRGRSYKHYPPAKLIGYLASHEPLAPPVEQHMLVHFDYEEHSFLQLLWTALHFCMNRNDRQCKNVINTLSKNLVLWEGEEKRSIWFFREASKMAPVSVVESIPLWTLQKNFIFNKTASTRKATANWLADIVFNPDPLSDNSQLDASRIRSTRWLVKECVPLLENAYRTDLQRGRYDSMIEAMESAKQYLAALETEVNSRQTNAATTASADGIAEVEDDSPTDSGSSTTLPAATQPLGSLPQEVRVEYREAAALNQRLEDLLHELLDWEPTETALPTRPIGVRRSVEFDGAEELGIGAEGGLEVDEESDADPEMELGSSSFDDGASDEQN